MTDYSDADLDLARFLATKRIGKMTDADSDGNIIEVGDGPPIFIGLLPPDPDEAIGIMGPWQNDVYGENDLIRLIVVVRGEPWGKGQVSTVAKQVYDELHEKTDVPLTASQTALLSRRIVNDAPTPDENGRWVRVDTYEMRMAVPT